MADLFQCILGFLWIGGKVKNVEGQKQNNDTRKSVHDFKEVIIYMLQYKKKIRAMHNKQ